MRAPVCPSLLLRGLHCRETLIYDRVGRFDSPVTRRAGTLAGTSSLSYCGGRHCAVLALGNVLFERSPKAKDLRSSMRKCPPREVSNWRSATRSGRPQMVRGYEVLSPDLGSPGLHSNLGYSLQAGSRLGMGRYRVRDAPPLLNGRCLSTTGGTAWEPADCNGIIHWWVRPRGSAARVTSAEGAG